MIDSRMVEVEAPSRLHCGMFSFGVPEVRPFGGLGMAIDRPGLRVRFSPAAALFAAGPMAERALTAARTVLAAWGVPNACGCQIDVLHAPRPHTGFGSGTQLALAVGTGLAAYLGRPRPAVSDLAAILGRGQRSQVGCQLFQSGGMVIESGKFPHEPAPPLVIQAALPCEWRFLVLTPTADSGLSGEAERRAFVDLPPVPLETTQSLAAEAFLHLAPAALTADFDRFAASLTRFARLAGSCFAMAQGGDFLRPDLVQWLHDHGATGVAQTSWGPTVFGMFPTEAAALRTADALANRCRQGSIELTIAQPRPHGTQVEVHPRP